MKANAIRWPNRQGWNVTIGRRYFEVFHHGAVRREVKDDAASCGFMGVEYTEPIGACPETAEGAIGLVKAMIHARVWQPCEGTEKRPYWNR